MPWPNFLRAFAAIATIATVAHAQSPAPLVVQAASPANVSPASAATIAPVVSPSVAAALKALTEVKAANAETLKRQEAVLDKLDEMQKAVDQLKIFAHRSGG